MNKHYIYKITCLCGKFKNHYYIGKRTTKNKYIYNDNYYGSGEKLRRYYKKYPPQNGVTIYKEIIEINPNKEINAKREKDIIGDLYKSDPLCLNLMEGGNGRSVSKETSKKKSSLMKGKKLSEETKRKMSIAKKRDNAIVSLTKYYKNNNVWNKGKIGVYGHPIACYDLEGNFIKEYSSITSANMELNISEGLINNCLNHPDKYHRTGDFMWTYAVENQPMKIESYSEKQNRRYSKLKKKIGQYTKDGELIKIWSSVKEIAKSFGYKSNSIIYKLIDNPNLPDNNCNNIYSYLWKKAS